MVIDPIIRFNWIFYAMYTEDLQHSTKVSFLVGFTEVCRRGMWMVFRVENEHCTNVGRFRASRDAPLPYEIASSSTTTLAGDSPQRPMSQGQQPQVPSQAPVENIHEPASSFGQATPAQASGVDLERMASHASPAVEALRKRRAQTSVEAPLTSTWSRVGTLLHSAHAQDFERRRKPELGASQYDQDDDDDDDEEEEDEVDEIEGDAEEEEEVEAREAEESEEGESDGEPGRSNGAVGSRRKDQSRGSSGQTGEQDVSSPEQGSKDVSEDEEGSGPAKATDANELKEAEEALGAAGRRQ